MTHLRRGDEDLHYSDGSHRTTAAVTAGHMITNYDRRIAQHLAEHRNHQWWVRGHVRKDGTRVAGYWRKRVTR